MADESLKQLQEELLQLKQQIPDLQLRKAAAARSPAAPFPITCRAEVAAPPEAERYDVSSFSVLARLNSTTTLLPDAPAPQGASLGRQVAAAVEVEVISSELPRALRQAMAGRLRDLWAASGPVLGHLNLHLLWAEAQRQFVPLITLLPELLEPYQTEDTSGSTVRRWALLNDEASVTIDASLPTAPTPKPAAASPRPAAKATAVVAGAPSGNTQQEGQPSQTPASASPGGAQTDAAALPRGLVQELQFVQKRHKLRLLPLQQAAGASSAAAAATATATASHLSGIFQTHTPAANARSGARQPTAKVGAGVEGAAHAGTSGGQIVAAFDLQLCPTDPAWEPAHPLLLRGWLSTSYPQAGSCVVEIASQQQPQLPLLLRQVLNKLVAAELAAAAGRPGALRSLVRYLENHAGRLWEQAEDIAAEVARRRREQGQTQQSEEQQHQGQRQQQQLVEEQVGQQALSGSQVGSTGSSSTSGYDSDGAYASDDSERSSASSASCISSSGASDHDGAEADEGGGSGGGHSDAVLPLALQLEGLQLEVDALELLRLNLQVMCSRCRAAGELSFATAAVALPSDGGTAGGRGRGSGTLTAAAECSTCHADWAVEVAPKLLHDRSNVLAHLRCQGCAPADLLPSMLAGQCSQCSATAAFRGVTVGRWNERNCSSCHLPMRFQFSTALFVPHRLGGQQQKGGSVRPAAGRSRGAGASPASDPNSRDAYNGLLQLGQPLPDRGTCKHYRHSYRWLRFPCCGRRFPCDLCHEEGTDHDLKWATRMVCGYCSLEQPVQASCKACAKKLATSAAAPSGRHTRFWEGGKGQRDPRRLHKDDPRRYRNKNKTRSAKSKRVGQEGKARREREQG